MCLLVLEIQFRSLTLNLSFALFDEFLEDNSFDRAVLLIFNESQQLQ